MSAPLYLFVEEEYRVVWMRQDGSVVAEGRLTRGEVEAAAKVMLAATHAECGFCTLGERVALCHKHSAEFWAACRAYVVT